MEVVRKIARTGTEFFASYITQWWPSLLALWCVFGYIFLFTPLEFSDAALRQHNGRGFVYTNISRKPFPSVEICTFKDSTVVVEPNIGRTTYQKDNSEGQGTGSSLWTTWRHTGGVPPAASSVVVYKVISYTCLGIFTKVVRTPVRILEMSP